MVILHDAGMQKRWRERDTDIDGEREKEEYRGEYIIEREKEWEMITSISRSPQK